MALRIFISYTHDSQEHIDRICKLADRLRNDGLDCRIDQDEQSPPEGWPHWCSNQVEEANFVLIACTATYQRRYEGKEEAGKGLGASWEGFVIVQDLYEAAARNTKYVPIVFSSDDGPNIPKELRAATRYELNSPEGYIDLLRRITGQPKRVPVPVSSHVPTLPPVERKSQWTPQAEVPSVPDESSRPEESRVTTSQPQLFTLPFPENRFFTGRKDELQGLKATLEANGIAALTGLSGIGKTQTAVRYAYDRRKDYEVVLWIRAESQETLVADLAQLAGPLQLPEREEKEQSVIVYAVKRWLGENQGWLMVLDNVIDLQTVAGLTELADASGRHVIVTTQADATGWIERQRLQPMLQDVGASLLLRRAKLIAPKQDVSNAKPKDAELARVISERVGGLPLALTQAGAFVENTKCGLAGYLELLTGRFAEVMSEPGDKDVRHQPVVATFSLSLEQLAQSNAAAVELLKAVAFLPPDAIPEEIFTEGAKEFAGPLQTTALDSIAWNKAIAAALDLSLLERNQDDRTLAVHRMVQEVVKSRMSPEERKPWAEQVVRAVNFVFPDPEFEVWDECERLLASAQVCAGLVDEYSISSAETARLLNNVALYLSRRARYAEAEVLYRSSLALCEQLFGRDSTEVAVRLNNLADLLRASGRSAEAEPLLQEALTTDENFYGHDHPEVATTLNNLALALKTMKRFAEAEEMYRRVVKIFKEASHPHYAGSLRNLARLLQDTNRLDEAELLLRQSLEINENTHGHDHPDVAMNLNDLGTLLDDTGRRDEAEPFYRRSLAILEKALGSDDPSTVTARANLAALLNGMGKDAEADKL